MNRSPGAGLKEWRECRDLLASSCMLGLVYLYQGTLELRCIAETRALRLKLSSKRFPDCAWSAA